MNKWENWFLDNAGLVYFVSLGISLVVIAVVMTALKYFIYFIFGWT